jgi:hypothetical protein
MLPIRRVGPVVKLGEGGLGGKAHALPFLERVLDTSRLREAFHPHLISVPETWVLATQAFAEFVSRNGLESCVDLDDDVEVRRRFLAAELTEKTRASLRFYLESHHLPLAVRSSALSEDTYHHATAGLFTTLFIPNRGEERARQLEEAIKLVFASAFFADVNHYMLTHSIPREEDQMAVALESVVGTTFGDVHYPIAAGVAQSVNYFPVGKMRPEDGVVTIVMGLGSRAVSGRDGMRFCPRYPLVRPVLQQNTDLRRVTQRLLDAVDLAAASVRLTGKESDTIRQVPIEETEAHGTLDEVASVLDEETGVFYESLFREGPRVVTFNRILRETAIPLPTALHRLLGSLQEAFGFPVEIEFALDLDRGVREGGEKRYHLVLLQARPLPSVQMEERVDIPVLDPEHVLIETSHVMGHGSADGIRYVVYVDPELFSLETSSQIASEVGALNEQVRKEGEAYLLLGPGRWGSCNKAVGVPVSFRQIDRARLIAEISTERLAVEPSQGTHFFHNLVSRDLFFLTVDARGGHSLRDAWLREQPNAAPTRYAKLIRVNGGGLSIRVDAHRGTGLVYFAGNRAEDAPC